MSDPNDSPFQPDDVSTPGEGIRQALAQKGWTVSDLAYEMDDYPLEEVTRMVNDDRIITIPDALELEDALGIPAETWMNLESSRQLSGTRKFRSGGPPTWVTVLQDFDRAGQARLGKDPAYKILDFLQELVIYRLRYNAPMSYVILDTDEALNSDDPEVVKWKDKVGQRTVREFKAFAALLRALNK